MKFYHMIGTWLKRELLGFVARITTGKSRSSQRIFCKKGVLENFAISQENTCVGVDFLKKLKPLLEKRLQHRCFPVKFAKFLRATIFKNICERLLLTKAGKHRGSENMFSTICPCWKWAVLKTFKILKERAIMELFFSKVEPV